MSEKNKKQLVNLDEELEHLIKKTNLRKISLEKLIREMEKRKLLEMNKKLNKKEEL